MALALPELCFSVAHVLPGLHRNLLGVFQVLFSLEKLLLRFPLRLHCHLQLFLAHPQLLLYVKERIELIEDTVDRCIHEIEIEF